MYLQSNPVLLKLVEFLLRFQVHLFFGNTDGTSLTSIEVGDAELLDENSESFALIIGEISLLLEFQIQGFECCGCSFFILTRSVGNVTFDD